MDSEKAALMGADDHGGDVPQTRRHRCRGRRGPPPWPVRLAVLSVAGFAIYNCSRLMSKPIPPASDPSDPSDSSTETCLTPACIHASSEILYNLSPKYKELDPCTDFEELVCGGWRERHDLRPDQGSAFTGTIMAENSQLLLRHILEAPYPKSSKHSFFSPMQLAATSHSVDEDNFEKMTAAYNACLNEDTIKDLGIAPLSKIIDEIKASYPLTAASDDALSNTILLLAKYGISALVSPGAGADDTNPDVVVVQVGAPWRIGLPSKERYEDDALVKKYEGVVVDVLSQLAPDEDKDVFASVVELEKKLAAASPSTQEREDVTKTYNPMSLKEASDLTPKIGLANIVSSLSPSDFKVDRVIVAAPKYLKELEGIIEKFDPAVLQSYFIWKAVQSLHSYIESPVVQPYKGFVNELAGKDPNTKPERWRTCVDHVDDSVGWILSRFFVEKAFSAAAKDFGDLIIMDIKREFIKKLKATEWMDDETTDKAIEKVHKIVQKIGYPTESPNIMDPESLASYYKKLSINSKTFFDNVVATRAFEVEDEWSALGKPVDRGRWSLSSSTVNAYYNPSGGEIVFPAGIMQFPVFDVNVPAYVSYGAFGSVAGHELSHAFDSTGRHYDQYGNYTDWWSNSTVKAFEERAQCFIDQYSNYTVPGPDKKPLHVNGRLTLGENIADAGGLSASFQAWTRRAKEKPNAHLPGLEHFTQEQLFFVSYSNWWCGKSRNDEAINRIYTDPHSPKWARILGTMSNSREFRESFQCESKKPTCELW
ncbi:putative metalloendopeptidase [Podospora aff. communis PSN243]|uniref:Metalloendopeptidase n=1 Tax=Podospora aff. communis PSN243 TaxID=3040156 RepID=A0AAV9GDI9_9PEZI|nr:putative metalloendopeptidase [Podospora aff. communis PSN243]